MQLQLLRRRLQALPATKKSLPEVLEIVGHLYRELNSAAILLTRRDMVNLLYICRETLSWGPAAISKVSQVLNLLVFTDTYIFTQSTVAGPLRQPATGGRDLHSGFRRSYRKYSGTQAIRGARQDRLFHSDSAAMPRNHLGRIFHTSDGVKALCRLYKRFFDQVSMTSGLPRDESADLFRELASCVLGFLRPIMFLLFRNTHRLHWFTTFLASMCSYLADTDLQDLSEAGLGFFTLVSEAALCILSPMQSFSEKYVNASLQRPALLSSRSSLSKEIVSAINSITPFQGKLSPHPPVEGYTADTHDDEDATDLGIQSAPSFSDTQALRIGSAQRTNRTCHHVDYLVKFYSLHQIIPVVTSITSKYSLQHIFLVHNWCSNLLTASTRGKNMVIVSELFLLFRLFEFYSDIPIVTVSHLSAVIGPSFFVLATQTFMQEFTVPLSTYLAALDSFVAQLSKQRVDSPTYTDVLSYTQHHVMQLMLNFSVQMAIWSGTNCLHLLNLFHKIPPITQLLLRNYMPAVEGDQAEVNILIHHSLATLHNYITGIILILKNASLDDLHSFFTNAHIGDTINHILCTIHLFDGPLLQDVASSLASLILELVRAIPRIFLAIDIAPDKSSIPQAADLFDKYALLIDEFLGSFFLSPASFFRITARYANAFTSRRHPELRAALNTVQVMRYVFTEPFLKELLFLLLTETAALNRLFNLLRIYRWHMYCEDERRALGDITAHTESMLLLKHIMRSDEYGLEYQLVELVIRPMTLIIRFAALEPFLSVLAQVLYSNIYLHSEQPFASQTLTDDFMLRLVIAYRPAQAEKTAFITYYKTLRDKGLFVVMLRLAQQCVFGDFYIRTVPSLASLVMKRHECTPIKITEVEAGLTFDILLMLFYTVFFPSPAHAVLLRRCIMSLVDYCSDHVILFSHLAAVFATREQLLLAVLAELPAMDLAALPPIESLLQQPDYFKEDDVFQFSRANLDGNVRRVLLQHITADLTSLLHSLAGKKDADTSADTYRGQTIGFVRSLTGSLNYLSMDRFSTLELTVYCYANIPFVGQSSRLSAMTNFIRLAPYSLLSNSLPFRSYVMRILAGEGLSLNGDNVAIHKSRNSIQTQNGFDMLIYPYTLASHHIYYAKIDFSFRRSLMMFLNDHASVSVLVENSIMYILVILEHYISSHAIFAEDMAIATTKLIYSSCEQAPNAQGSGPDPVKKSIKMGPVVRSRPYRHKVDDFLLPLTRDVHEPKDPDADVYNGVLGRYPSFVDFLRRQMHDCALSHLNLSAFQTLPTTSFELVNFALNAEHPIQYSDIYASGRHILSPIAFGEIALLIKGRLGAYGEMLLNRFWASVPHTLGPESHTQTGSGDTQVYRIHINMAEPAYGNTNVGLPAYKHVYTEEELSKLPSVQLKVCLRRAAHHYASFFARQPIFFLQLSMRNKPDCEVLTSTIPMLLEQAWKTLGINLGDFVHAQMDSYWAMPVDELVRVLDNPRTLCASTPDAATMAYIASLHYILLSMTLQSTTLQWPISSTESCPVNGRHLLIYILSVATAKHNYDVLNVFLVVMLGKCEQNSFVISDSIRQFMIVIIQELFLKLDAIDMVAPHEQLQVCKYGVGLVIGIQTCLFLEHGIRYWVGSHFPVFHICRFLLALFELTSKLRHQYILRISIALGLLPFVREVLSAQSNSSMGHELIPMAAFALVSISKVLRQAVNTCVPIYELMGQVGSVPMHPLLWDCVCKSLYKDASVLHRLTDWIRHPPTFWSRIVLTVLTDTMISRILSSCPGSMISLQDETSKIKMAAESVFHEISMPFLNNSAIFHTIKTAPYRHAREQLVHGLNILCDVVYTVKASHLDLKSHWFYASLYGTVVRLGCQPQQCFSNLYAFARGQHYDVVFAQEAKIDIAERMDTIRLCGLVHRTAITFVLQLISGLSSCVAAVDTGAQNLEDPAALGSFFAALRVHLIETCFRGIAAFADETRYARYFSFFGYEPLTTEQAERYAFIPPTSMDITYTNRQIFYTPIVAVSWITLELRYLYNEMKTAAEYIASGLVNVRVEGVASIIQPILQPVVVYYEECTYPSPLFFKLCEILIRYFNYMSEPFMATLLSVEKLRLITLTDDALYTELTANKLFPYAYLLQYAFLNKSMGADWVLHACANHRTMVNNILKACIYRLDRVLYLLLCRGDMCQDHSGRTVTIADFVSPELLAVCKGAIDTLQSLDMCSYLYNAEKARMQLGVLHHVCNPPVFAYKRHTPVGLLSFLFTYAHGLAAETVPDTTDQQLPVIDIPRSYIDIFYASASSASWLLPVLCISYSRYMEYVASLVDRTCIFIDANRALDAALQQALSLHISLLLKLVCVALYIGKTVAAYPQRFNCLSSPTTQLDPTAEKEKIRAACSNILRILPQRLAQFRSITLNSASTATQLSTLREFYFLNPDVYVAQYKLHSSAFLHLGTDQKNSKLALPLHCLGLDNVYLCSLRTLFPLGTPSDAGSAFLSVRIKDVQDEEAATDLLMTHLPLHIASFGGNGNYAAIYSLLETYFFPLLYSGVKERWISFDAYCSILRHYVQLLAQMRYDLVGLHPERMVCLLEVLILRMESYKPVLYVTILMLTQPQHIFANSVMRLFLCEATPAEIGDLDDTCLELMQRCYWYKYKDIVQPGTDMTDIVSGSQYFLAFCLMSFLRVQFAEETRISFWRLGVPLLRMLSAITVQRSNQDAACCFATVALLSSYVTILVSQASVMPCMRLLFFRHVVFYINTLRDVLAQTRKTRLLDNDETILLSQSCSELVFSVGTFILGLDVSIMGKGFKWQDPQRVYTTLEHNGLDDREQIGPISKNKQKHLLFAYRRLLPRATDDALLGTLAASLIGLVHSYYTHVLLVSDCTFDKAAGAVYKALAPYVSAMVFMLLKISVAADPVQQAPQTLYQESQTVLSKHSRSSTEWIKLYTELSSIPNADLGPKTSHVRRKHTLRVGGSDCRTPHRVSHSNLRINHATLNNLLLGLYGVFSAQHSPADGPHHAYMYQMASCVIYIPVESVNAGKEDIQSSDLDSADTQFLPPQYPEVASGTANILPVHIELLDIAELVFSFIMHGGYITEYRSLLLTVAHHSRFPIDTFLPQCTSFMQRLSLLAPFNQLPQPGQTASDSIKVARQHVSEECYYYLAKIAGCLFTLHQFVVTLCSELCAIYATDWKMETFSPMYNLSVGSPAFYSLNLAAAYSAQNIDRGNLCSALFSMLTKYVHAYRYYSRLLKPLLLHLKATYSHSHFAVLGPVLRFVFLLLCDITSGSLAKITMAFTNSSLYNVFFLGYTDIVYGLEEITSLIIVAFSVDRDGYAFKNDNIPAIVQPTWSYMKTYLAQLLDHYKSSAGASIESGISQSFFLQLYSSLYMGLQDVCTGHVTRSFINILSLSQEYLDLYLSCSSNIVTDTEASRTIEDSKLFTFLAHFNHMVHILRCIERSSFIIITSTLLFQRILVYFNAFINFTICNIDLLRRTVFQEFESRFKDLVTFLIHFLNKNVGYYIGLLEPTPTVSFPAIDNEILLLQQNCNYLYSLFSINYSLETYFWVSNLAYYTSDLSSHFIDSSCRRILWDIILETISWYDGSTHAAAKEPLTPAVRERLVSLGRDFKQRERQAAQTGQSHSYIQRELELVYISLDEGVSVTVTNQDPAGLYLLPAAFLYDISSQMPGELPDDIIFKALFSQISPNQPLNLLRTRNGAFLLLVILMRLAVRPLADMDTFFRLTTVFTNAFAIMSSFATETCSEFIIGLLNARMTSEQPWSINLATERQDAGKYNSTCHPSLLTERFFKHRFQRLLQRLLIYLPTLRYLDNFLFTRNSFYTFILNILVAQENFSCEPNNITLMTESFSRHIPQQTNVFMGGLMRNFSKSSSPIVSSSAGSSAASSLSSLSFIPVHAEPVIGGIGGGLPHIGNTAGNKYGFGMTWLLYEFLLKQWRAGPPVEYSDTQLQMPGQPEMQHLSNVPDWKHFYSGLRQNVKAVTDLINVANDLLSCYSAAPSLEGSFFHGPMDSARYLDFSRQMTDQYLNSLTLTHDTKKITNIYLELLAFTMQIYDRVLFLPVVYECIETYRTKIVPNYAHCINHQILGQLENKFKALRDSPFLIRKDKPNDVQKKLENYHAAAATLYAVKERFQARGSPGDGSLMEGAKEVIAAERTASQAYRTYLDAQKMENGQYIEAARIYNYLVHMYFQIFTHIATDEKNRTQVDEQTTAFNEFRDHIIPRNAPAFTLPRAQNYNFGDINFLREKLFAVIISIFRLLHIDIEGISGSNRRAFNLSGLNNALSWELFLRRSAQAGIKLLNDKELKLGWLLPLKLTAPSPHNLLEGQYISLSTSNWRLTRVNVFRVNPTPRKLGADALSPLNKFVYRPNFIYAQKSLAIQELYYKIYSRMVPAELFSMKFLKFTNQYKEGTSVSISYIRNLIGERPEDSSEYLLIYVSETRNFYYKTLRSYLPPLSDDRYSQLFTYWLTESYLHVEQAWPRTVRRDTRPNTNSTKLIPNTHLAVERNIELLNMPRTIIQYFLSTHGTYALDYFIDKIHHSFYPKTPSMHDNKAPIWNETGGKFKDNMNLIQQRFRHAAETAEHQDRRDYLQVQESNKIVSLFNYLKSILVNLELPSNSGSQYASAQGGPGYDKVITGGHFPNIHAFTIRSNLFPGPAEELFGIHLPITVLANSLLYYTQNTFSPAKQGQDVPQNLVLYSSPSLDEERVIQPSVLSMLTDDIFLFASIYPQEAIEFVLKSAILKRSLCTYRFSESQAAKALPYCININAADFSHLAPIVGFQIARYVPNAYMPGLQGIALTYQLTEFISGSDKYEQYCNSMLDLRLRTLHQAFLADNQVPLATALNSTKYPGLFSCNSSCSRADSDQSILKSAFSCDAMLTNLTVESQIYLLYFALTNPLDNAPIIRRLLLAIRDTLISERVFLEASNTSLIYQYADLSDIYSTLLQSIHMARRFCLQLTMDPMITQASNTPQSHQLLMKKVMQSYKSSIHLPIVGLLSNFRARYKDIYLSNTRDMSTWATCRLMIIITYSKVFAPPYQYLDTLYDDIKTSPQIRSIMKHYSTCLWDYLRNSFLITRPHTLNSITEHAIMLGIPAAARMINKKETNLDGIQKLANDTPFVAEIFRCIRGQAFSLMNSGIFLQQKGTLDPTQTGQQHGSLPSEGGKVEGGNFTALDVLAGHLENTMFKSSNHIRDQKNLFEELRTSLGHLRILVERAELSFPATGTDNITLALRNLGAGSNGVAPLDLPRYWQINTELFIHHTDLLITRETVQTHPRYSRSDTVGAATCPVLLDSQLDALDQVLVLRAWDLLVSLCVSCLNSISSVGEAREINMLNRLHENLSLERAIANKGTPEDNAAMSRRSKALRHYRNVFESRFYESRDKTALATFNTLLTLILMPPSLFYAIFPAVTAATCTGVRPFDKLNSQAHIQWTLIDCVSMYMLATSVMHIHPHHIAYNCRRIYCAIVFSRYSVRRSSVAKVGFLAGLLLNMYTDCGRQYPVLLKDGNYAAFPPYYVSPRTFIELAFILGIDILEVRDHLIKANPILDDTRQTSAALLRNVRYWDILLVLLRDKSAYKKELHHFGTIYQFDVFAALYKLARRQPLLREVTSMPVKYKIKHDGLLLWISLCYLATLSGEVSLETGLENDTLTTHLLTLQAIFIEYIGRLVLHSVQAQRKKVAYDILIDLILSVEAYVRSHKVRDLEPRLKGSEMLSTLLNFGFLLFVFAYAVYPIDTPLETDSMHLIVSFDGVSAGTVAWYYSITEKMCTALLPNPGAFLDRHPILLQSYRNLILEDFPLRRQLLVCIDKIVSAQGQHQPATERDITFFERLMQQYLRYLMEIIARNNMGSTDFWGMSVGPSRRLHAPQISNASLGCQNMHAGATTSPCLTDIVGGYYYDDGLLYSENSISSATHVNIDSFGGVLPVPDASYAMPVYSNRIDRISNGIANSLKEDVLNSLIHTANSCKKPAGPVILFISGLPVVKLTMTNVGHTFGGATDYLVLEIPSNQHIVDCLSVLAPHTVPLRMGLYKDASNIINEAVNASSHVAFWDRYINISRRIHVYQCKQSTYIDKFTRYSAASVNYNYRKLFGMRKAVSIGMAQKMLLHELFNIPEIQLENAVYDLSTGEVVSFAPLVTPNMYGDTPVFKALCLRSMLVKGIATGKPAEEVHRLSAASEIEGCRDASQSRASVGQILVHTIGLQVLMAHCPLAISRAVRHMLLDSKSRYPQTIAQNASGSISVQNSTAHISQAWMNEISLQLFTNGLIEGYEDLSRVTVSQVATLLTSTVGLLDARIPISRVSTDESDHAHISDVSELTANDSLAQPALEYVAYCIDAGMGEA